MTQMDLFSLMGFEPVEEEKKAKESKKANSKNKADVKAKTKVAPEKKDTVTFPITVVSGFSSPVTYSKDDFDKDVVNSSDVFDKWVAEHPSYSKKFCGYVCNDNSIFIFFKKKEAVAKGSFTVNADTRYCLGDVNLDLSAFMTDVECEIDAKTLIDAFKEEYPKYGDVRMLHSAEENLIVPCFVSASLSSSVSGPVTVSFWGHEDIIIGADDTSSGRIENKDESEDNEEPDESDEASLSAAPKFNSKAIRKKIVEVYPELKGGITLLHDYSSTGGSVIVTITESNVPAEAKKKVYPTDAEVSLFISTRFKLSPEMFSGKSEITEDELISFLEERFPEFSKERTIIVYDEKRKLIMPCLKSSSKGALDIVRTAEEEVRANALPFPYLKEFSDGSIYRIEKNAVAEFQICTFGNQDKNFWRFHLPKVPLDYMLAIKDFFSDVYKRHGTEAMVQLFFNPDSNSYFVYVPVQKVSRGAVNIVRNCEVEYHNILVADIHSHGFFPAFWSEVDNTDEKGSRIFGVFGSFRGEEKNLTFKCRIGCGGYFMDIHTGDFVDTKHTADEEKVVSLTNTLISDGMSAIQIMN